MQLNNIWNNLLEEDKGEMQMYLRITHQSKVMFIHTNFQYGQITQYVDFPLSLKG